MHYEEIPDRYIYADRPDVLAAHRLRSDRNDAAHAQSTLSRTHIAFSYGGDLWTVSREGGEASRLTTGVGNEANPIFSPDGRWIAFTGEYDGNVDVYLVTATGGVPKRLTYHPGNDNLVGWTPDGKSILFVSSRNSYSGRFARLFTMAVDGTVPTEVPLPMGYEGSFSPDAAKIAYVPLPRGFQAWKRYRGGMTTPIWIANLTDSSIEQAPAREFERLQSDLAWR